MRQIIVRKMSLHNSEVSMDLKGRSPQELIGMIWQLALDAWSFKERINVEPRLQRHVIVLKRRRS